MLISTDQVGWSLSSKSGRILNKFNPNIQDNAKTISSEVLKIDAVMRAIELTDIYKDKYKKTTDKSIIVIKAVYARLLSHPDRKLQINRNIVVNDETLITTAGLKKIVIKMEELGHIKIYQGYTYKEPNSKHSKARPMCIELIID
jgi:hypothetical protein